MPSAFLRPVDRRLAHLAALTLLCACSSPGPRAEHPTTEMRASAAPEADAPIPPRRPVPVAECPLHWTPKDIRASVMTIPAAVAGRFMNPLMNAACACMRPGERAYIVATILPERGEIGAVTADRQTPETSADPSIDACFAEVLGKTTFETFEVGSDVVCDEPAPPPSPNTKGPPFFRAPRRADCPEPGTQTSKIVYPLLVER